MTIYTKFSDIPDSVWVDGDVIGSPLEFHARLTEWFLYNTADETMPLSAVPAGYRQSVSDALWNDDVATYDGVLSPRNPKDKPLRKLAVSLITKLHDDDIPFADVVTLCGSEDTANRVLDWCSRRSFVRHDGGTVRLDGVLARLRDYAEPAPEKPAPEKPAPAPAKPVYDQMDEGLRAPVAYRPKPTTPSTSPTGISQGLVSGAAITADPALLARAVHALEMLADQAGSPMTPVTPVGDSPILDTARELAVLMHLMQPATRHTLRERVRSRLRMHTSAALEFGVQQRAFVLVGSPVRGGTYSLSDPEVLGMDWSVIRSLAAGRKPARALVSASR